MKTALTVLLCISLSYLGMSQQLEFDNYTVILKSFETRTITLSGNPPRDFYEGTIQVRQNGSHKEFYRFRFPKSTKNTALLIFKTQMNKPLNPFLTYDKTAKDFSYSPENDPNIMYREKSLSNTNEKEIILSGMIAWLKAQQSK